MAVLLLPTGASIAAEGGQDREVASAPHEKSLPASTRPQPPPLAIVSEFGRVPVTTLPELTASEIAEGVRQAGPSWLGSTRPVPGPADGRTGATDSGGITGRWYRLGDQAVWRAALTSPGASSLRLRLTGFDAPGDLYLTGGGSDLNYVGPYSARGPQGDGDYWSGIIRGDTVTVHYLLPAGSGTPSRLPFQIASLAHLRGLPPPISEDGLQDNRAGESEPVARSIVGCHIDVSCYPEWESRTQPSVAKILIPRGSGWIQCSGVLINPRYESDTTLLMLTAGHCLSSNEQAMNAVFVWNDQTTQCYGQPPSRYQLAQTTGARLIDYRDDRTGDWALLRLSKQAVLRVSGYWSRGWTAGYIRDETPVVAVSHPDAAFKRLSLGHLEHSRWTGLSETDYTGIRWRQGTTEGGSSGSGVLRESDGRLVGVMVGGSRDHEPCSPEHRGVMNRLSEIYGRIRPYLESERSVLGGRPSEIEVSLGRSGETVTITARADGTFWIGSSRVTDGSRVTSRNGSVYRLRLSRDGTWTATYLPVEIEVRLGISGDIATITVAEDGTSRIGNRVVTNGSLVTARNGNVYLLQRSQTGRWTATYQPTFVLVLLEQSSRVVLIRSAEDGTYWIDDWLVIDGGIYVAPDGYRYRLRQAPDGEWAATYEPHQIELLGGALTVPILPADDGSYQMHGERVPDQAAITHALYGTFRLQLDRRTGQWRSEPVPSGVPLAVSGMGIERVAGIGPAGFGGDGGSATLANLASPSDVTIDNVGNVLIADTENHRIRRVSPSGTISTVAGTGVAGFSGDGGDARNAQLRTPRGITVGPRGTIFVSDSGNNRIRAINSFGTIRTIAGGGEAEFGTDSGPALQVRLSNPHALAVDRQGNLFIADADNHRVRRLTSGAITTVAGTGWPRFGGDGGPAQHGSLRFPKGVAVDAAGVIYVADTGNNRIRRIARTGEISTVMGLGVRAFSGDGGLAAEATLSLPRRVAVAPDGSLYVADYRNDAVRRIDRHGFVRTIAGSGEASASVDVTPALRARIDGPLGLAVGDDGQLLFVDSGANRVLRLTPAWNVVTVEALPSPVHVELDGDGDWTRLWRAADSAHFHQGYPFRSGDQVWNWDASRAYRLDRSFSGWQSEEVEFDYVDDFETSLSAATAGDAEAQANVGAHYLLGLGAREDDSAALRWLRLAESQGHRSAPFLLGVMYELGRGVEADPTKAAEWYALGAQRGDPWSQTGLGSSLLLGEGIEQDVTAGVLWVLRAAMQDYAAAQSTLGFLLEGNLTVPESSAEAFAWTRFAALAGRPADQFTLGRFYRDGYGVVADASQAARWLQLAANRGGAPPPPAPPPAPPQFEPQEVRVTLGDSGTTVILYTNQDGGFTLGGRPFNDGGEVSAANGDIYVLRLVDGIWVAYLKP